MFPRLIALVGIGLLAVFALDFFFLRRRGKSQPSVFWEAAPVLGFIGAILLALAFVEAARREVVAAWNWGIGFGFLLVLIAGLAWWLRPGVSGGANRSGWRAWARIAQTYGIVLLVGLLGIVIAVRVIGAMLQVFIASALGVLGIAIGLGVIALASRRS